MLEGFTLWLKQDLIDRSAIRLHQCVQDCTSNVFGLQPIGPCTTKHIHTIKFFQAMLEGTEVS